MSKPNLRELMLARKAEVEEQLAQLNAKAAPLRELREKLRAMMEPLEADLTKVNQALKEIEQPHKGNLELQVAALNKALTDKVVAAMEVTG